MLLRLCEEDACGKSRECSDKRTGERVAGFFDSGSHKVNTHRIEDCLCTRQRDRCDHTKTGVCAELFENIEEESCRCRRREHFYDSKRNEFAGKPILPVKFSSRPEMKSRNPEARSIPTAAISPISVGMIRTTVKKPLFAPLINVS